MTPQRDLQVRDRLDEAEHAEVYRLIARAEAADGVAALNEQALLALAGRRATGTPPARARGRR